MGTARPCRWSRWAATRWKTACSFCWLRGRSLPAGQGCGSAPPAPSSRRDAIYPQEFLLLQSLVLHWNTAFPDCQLNDPDALDAILRGLHILDYNLHTVSYPIKNTRIPGFVGSAVVEARLALPLLELWNALLSFAPYGGIGIKTTLGMGGVSVEPLAPPQRSL